MPLKSLRIADDLMTEIESLASEHGLSVEQQADQLLRACLRQADQGASLLEKVLRISTRTPTNIVQIPAEQIIRELRDQ